MPSPSPNNALTPDFNAYTSFFRTLALPQLLDRSLQQLYEAHPVSAVDALNTFLEVTTASKEWFFNVVADQFEFSVLSMEEHGFPVDDGVSSPMKLHFSVPLRDGTAFEIFPTGNTTEVTPNNYDHFARLLKLYRQMLAMNITSPNSEAYTSRAIPLLPLSARANLLNPRYSTTLQFVQEYLLRGNSLWRIKSGDMWDALEITYAVPFNSRLIPVERNVSPLMPVPWSEAAQYVEKAQHKMRQLERLSKSGAPLKQAMSGDDVDDGTLSAHQRPKSHAATAEEEAREEENSFWDQLHLIRENPTMVKPGQISFLLQLPYGQVSLKENGEFLTLTPQNVPEFVKLAESKWQEIHRAFIGPGGSRGGVMSGESKREYKQQQQQQQDDEDLTYIQRFAPERSPEWNPRVQPTAEDLVSPRFDSVRELRNGWLNGTVDEAALEEAAQFFCLQSRNGIYNLVPNGYSIRVTMKNASEFFSRFMMECTRISQRERENFSSNTVNTSTSSAGGGGGGQVCVSPVPPSIPQPHAKRNSTVGLNNSPSSSKSYPTDVPVQLRGRCIDASDLDFLNDFERNTISLSAAKYDEEAIASLDLKWDIVTKRHCSIPLRPNGASLSVSPGEFDCYVAAVLDKIREIKAVIERRGYYIVTDEGFSGAAGGRGAAVGKGGGGTGTVSLSSNTSVISALREQMEIHNSMYMRETAVPQRMSAAEKALFSPTHNTAGLFAPPEHLNL